MRVGIYANAVLPPEAGGGYTFQADIVDALCRSTSAHELFVLFMGPDITRSSEHARFIPLAPYYAARRRPWKSAVRAADRLMNAGRRRSNSIVQHPLSAAANAHGIDLLWYLALDNPVLDRPFVATVWDLAHRMLPMFPEVSTQGWTWDQRESLYSRALPRAACVVTGTAQGKSQIERFYGVDPDRIEILPFPTPSFALQRTEVDAPKTAKPYVFYPAQFWPHKNHIVILHALKRLRDEHGRVIAAVFSGSDKGSLGHVRGEAARLGLAEQVHFPGFTPRDELVAHYRHAGALVFPSFFGPDNLPPLEAFALGCPVIAANVPGAREQLGDAAILVDPTDERAWARAIDTVLSDESARGALISKGLERAPRWTADDYVARMHQTIDAIGKYLRCWT